ncbi:MAG: regulatory protein RecX [Clostridia bacterium]|nr:regulatory protein RecX [Clostridia bacterium]
MRIELTSGALSESGKEVYLTVEMREGERREKRSFTLPRAVFEGLGLPTPPSEITRENVYELLAADEQYRAIKKAFDILAFGRNSVRTLTDKLRHRGFSDEVAASAAEYMQKNGYLKEIGDAEREAECCVQKLWGKKRIMMHLHQKGYDGEAFEAAMAYLGEVDFVQLCVKLIRQKYRTLPKDDKERQKVIAGLVRMGYTFSEIKDAARVVEYYKLPGDI